MFLSWILTVLTSIFVGAVIALAVQYYLFLKYFKEQKVVTTEKKVKLESFQLPKVCIAV